MKTVKGTFEIKLEPKPGVFAEGVALNALTIDKTLSGPLSGTTKGMVMSVMGGVKGSASYVALEVVSASLEDKVGTFVLQHNGIVDRGQASLTVQVVPDSGTGELEGIKGTFDIKVEDGVHAYEFTYALP